MANQVLKEYDDLKKILKSSDGKELYSHLTECFNNLILYYPDEALDKFEEVSYLLKDDDKTKMRRFLNLDNTRDNRPATEAKAAYALKAASLFPRAAEAGADADDTPEPATAGKLANLLADAEVMQWAGVSFGDTETYRLQASLTKLSVSSGSDKLRLWGRVYGTLSDYYVAEGFVAGADDDEGEKPKGFEERGSGVNEFVYWVATDSLSEWTALPDATPDLLQSTRSVKVKFTGDLERSIVTNPFFFGKEKHYLRAQIARITQSTTIMPAGLHKLAEDNAKEIEPIEFEDEAKAYVPSTESQATLSNWVHAKKSILKNNRVSHLDPEGEEFGDMEPEDVQKALDKRDPQEPRLKPLSEDTSPSGNEPAWTVRLVGDQARTAGLKGKSEHFGVAVVRSHVWAGAVTCWKGSRFIQMYVGDGHKSEAATYYPVYPPAVPEDPEDQEEYPEPNPSQAPQVNEEDQQVAESEEN
jgi:hypothetical protein